MWPKRETEKSNWYKWLTNKQKHKQQPASTARSQFPAFTRLRTALQQTSTKGPDIPAPGKVRLSCGWFTGLRTALYLAPDLGPICLGRPDKELLPPKTQFPGSQGHKPSKDDEVGYANSSTLSWWCITAKNNKKDCRCSWLKGVSFAGCLGSSLGTGWGVCISGWSQTTTLSCGEGASWGGLGICLKCFP